MKRLALMAAVVLLAEGMGGCAVTGKRPEPIIKTVEVKIPVAVPCKTTVAVRESYSDAAAEFSTNIFEQVRALLIGREERKEDAAKLKGAVTGCGGAATAK